MCDTPEKVHELLWHWLVETNVAAYKGNGGVIGFGTGGKTRRITR